MPSVTKTLITTIQQKVSSRILRPLSDHENLLIEIAVLESLIHTSKSLQDSLSTLLPQEESKP